MNNLVNKKETTIRIMNYGVARHCTKLELQNIVFPKWSDLGLLGMMFRQELRTKEQPNGTLYDEATFQTVMRIIGGKLLISGRPDCYCWKFEKVANAKSVDVIGVNSADGLLNLCKVLEGIFHPEEKKMLADMFANMRKDLLLVTTPSEERTCIEVTQDLYLNHGITYCVDEWEFTDAFGNAKATQLSIGDFMIVTENGVYRIARDEFMETHSL